MLPAGIVIAMNIFKNFGVSVMEVFKRASLKHFSFESPKEGLRPSIIVGVRASRHVLREISIFRSIPEGLGAILAASITVENSGLCGFFCGT